MWRERRLSGVIAVASVELLPVQNFLLMAGVKWLSVALTLNVVMCGLWYLNIATR